MIPNWHPNIPGSSGIVEWKGFPFYYSWNHPAWRCIGGGWRRLIALSHLAIIRLLGYCAAQHPSHCLSVNDNVFYKDCFRKKNQSKSQTDLRQGKYNVSKLTLAADILNQGKHWFNNKVKYNLNLILGEENTMSQTFLKETTMSQTGISKKIQCQTALKQEKYSFKLIVRKIYIVWNWH